MSFDADINDLKLLDEVVSYDPEAELNPQIMVPDGRNLVEVSLGSKGVQVHAQQNGKAYIDAHVRAKFIAPGTKYDGAVRSGFISSIVFEGGTSALHQLLKAVKSPAPQSCALSQLKALVEQALGGTPQCNTRTSWEAKWRNEETGKFDKNSFQIKGMKNFPLLPDGSYSPKAMHNNVEQIARETFKDWQPIGNGNGAGA